MLKSPQDTFKCFNILHAINIWRNLQRLHLQFSAGFKLSIESGAFFS